MLEEILLIFLTIKNLTKKHKSNIYNIEKISIMYPHRLFFKYEWKDLIIICALYLLSSMLLLFYDTIFKTHYPQKSQL